MTKNAEGVLLKKSKLTTNGKPNLPAPGKLVEGELAINYAEGVETISTKNESGDVVTFSSDEYYTKQKLGSGFTGVNSAKTVTDAIGDAEEVLISSGITPINNNIELWVDTSVDPVTVEIYTKDETNSLLNTKLSVNDFNTYSGTVDTALSNKLDTSAYTPTDLSNYYTKDETSGSSEISAALNNKADNTDLAWEKGTGVGSAKLISNSGTASGDYSVSEGEKTIASGSSTHAEGYMVTAHTSVMPGVHAEGFQTYAGYGGAHAEGDSTSAMTQGAHSEGKTTIASGVAAHAEGSQTTASGQSSHAEGHQTTAFTTGMPGLHAEGFMTYAGNGGSHAEGHSTSATSIASHAEGQNTIANGETAHAEGFQTSALTQYSHTEGQYTSTNGTAAHAEGDHAIANGASSHAEGTSTSATSANAHAEGNNTLASGVNSHAEGVSTSAITSCTHAEGCVTKASGYASHTEGDHTIASGDYGAHAEGSGTTASGDYSAHAEGRGTTASGSYGAHAEGELTVASGSYGAHAEGELTVASGRSSHAEGVKTNANGSYSHAEGSGTTANGMLSHAEGFGTITNNPVEHTSGQYNVSSSGSSTFGDSGNTLFSVGNGANASSRHNAFEIRQNGDIYIVNKDGNDVKLQDEIGNIDVDQVLDNTTSASTNPVSSKAVYDAVTDNELVWTNAYVALSGAVSSHTSNTDIHVTAADKTAWNGAVTSSHTHSNKSALDSITGNVGTMAYEAANSYSSATEVNTALGNKLEASDVADFFDDAKYELSGTTHVINFYNGNTVKATIDADDFIKDGMISGVTLESKSGTTYLVIEWNTDAGIQTTELNIGDLFEADNYYQKTETSGATELSTAFGGKADTATTLAGYGITDAYTKSETSGATEISNALGGKADTGHTHVSSGVTAMTGYAKAASGSSIATGDTLNQAIGKIEAYVDDLNGQSETIAAALVNLNENKLGVSAFETYSGTVDTTLSAKASQSDLNTHTANTSVHVSQSLLDEIASLKTAIYSENGHPYVEIGGVKWATMNIGANSVTDTGLYFQWGSTVGYTGSQAGTSGTTYAKPFNWADYKFGNGTSSPGATGMTKYNSGDTKTVLDLSDDAAHTNWGGSWRMPTTEEFVALGNAVNTAWTANYKSTGVKGMVCTAKDGSGAELFFPAAGGCYDSSVNYVGSSGGYWSSSLGTSSVRSAYYLLFLSGSVLWQSSNDRFLGFSVRPVVG